MTGLERRNRILNDIKKSREPLAGSQLAEKYNVSRQVIVQDIALLRASGYDIMSTTKGYVVNQEASYLRVIHVVHNDDEIQNELNTIVDLGGKVLDVYVDHQVYGRLTANLNISSRRDTEKFMKQLLAGHSTPLNRLTSGKHSHTIEADSKETLDLIEETLKDKGYIIE